MKGAWPIALALFALLGLATTGQAEQRIVDNIVVTFDGGIEPRALPRHETAPVSVSIASSFGSTDGVDPPPQLRTISIAINRRGKIFDRGLPTCRVRKIQPTTIRAARRICGGAIVGSGHIEVRVRLDNQLPFTFKGAMLIFNGRRSGGERRLLAQVYGRKPPSAFVLTFKVLKVQGELGTLIKTSLPQSARDWAYVTRFDMKLRRTYTYRGKRQSFISAACPAPDGFTIGFFKFAKADFGFADGTHVTQDLTRECAVR